MAFDYFYGQQAEQFSFYRIPKVLFADQRFSNISTDAKVLYGVLLDRMNLSARNDWLDQDGRVYIIFTIEEIMEKLSCGNKKAVLLLTELERKAELIERKRQGLGKPNLIYVKNFIRGHTDDLAAQHFQKCQNDTSGNVKITRPEMSEQHGNNIDNNDIDWNHTNPFPSIALDDVDYDGGIDRGEVRKYLEEQLEYSYLIQDYPCDTEILEEILELLVDTCCTGRKYVRIAGDDKPVEVVKKRLMELRGGHIRYVLSCLQKNTTKVRNIKQYLLAVLYNASLTMNNYYSALVQCDKTEKKT